MIFHPYAALACIVGGAVLLALVAVLIVLVLALRLGRVCRERDRYARNYLRALRERREMVERLDATRHLVISRPPQRPSVHFGDAELGAIARRVPAIRLRSSAPAREG